jgi:predicted nucleotidyltransferase component of viral defense system
VLGWLLWGIGTQPALRDRWVFKGGTCLKKCFVETYRFSEDLDFTVLDDGPLKPDDLLPVLTEMLDFVEQEIGITLSSRLPAVRLRPDGRSAEGRIYYRGPRATPGEARVKLDLTYDETIVETPIRREIAHAYDETLPDDGAVQCYAFVEVFTDKLRALGQRTRPRDLYDVVNLYRRADLRENRDVVLAVLERKCAYKDVPVPTLAAVTATEKAADLRADWGAMLAHQLPVLPPVEEFIDALEDVFARLSGEEPAQPGPTPAVGEEIDATWVVPPTLTRWPDGAPLEQIRFAGANHLLVELDYQASTRLIEPYPAALQGWRPPCLRNQGSDRRSQGLPSRPHRRRTHHRHGLHAPLRDRTVGSASRKHRPTWSPVDGSASRAAPSIAPPTLEKRSPVRSTYRRVISASRQEVGEQFLEHELLLDTLSNAAHGLPEVRIPACGRRGADERLRRCHGVRCA